jgi:hypothetical protein
LVDDHVSIEEPPELTDVGFAEIVAVGAGFAVTVTVADWVLDVPPAPVHAKLKVLVAVRAPVLCVPEVALEPLHAPLAVQPVALVDDHVSVEEPPELNDVGFAEIVAVGAGFAVTVTVVDAACDVPPAPVQVSVKVVVAVRLPVETEPAVAFDPLQPSLAAQPVASVELHVSELDEPLLTDVGDALIVAVGTALSEPPAPDPHATPSDARARSNIERETDRTRITR